MHEQRLVADLIKRATEVAAEHHAEHLSVMTVRVGALSHVAAGSIAAQIRQSAIGTPVENARIDVVMGPEGRPPSPTSMLKTWFCNPSNSEATES